MAFARLGEVVGAFVLSALIASSRLQIVKSRCAPISIGASDSSSKRSADFICVSALFQALVIRLAPEHVPSR